MRSKSPITVLACLLMPILAAGEVTIEVGPTSIPRGDAQGARDITINNGVFVVAFVLLFTIGRFMEWRNHENTAG